MSVPSIGMPQPPLAPIQNPALNLDFKKMGQQLVPDATQQELQAFRDSGIAGVLAGTKAYQDALTFSNGNKEYAYKQHAETVFDISLKMLAATPEGQSFIQKGNALRNLPNPVPAPASTLNLTA